MHKHPVKDKLQLVNSSWSTYRLAVEAFATFALGRQWCHGGYSYNTLSMPFKCSFQDCLINYKRTLASYCRTKKQCFTLELVKMSSVNSQPNLLQEVMNTSQFLSIKVSEFNCLKHFKMYQWFRGIYLHIREDVLEPWHLYELRVTSDNKCRCSSRHHVKPVLHPIRLEFNL